MKIYYYSKVKPTVQYGNGYTTVKGVFKSKNDVPISYIIINKNSRNWQLELCHELGHVLLSSRFYSLYISAKMDVIREEVMAWRLAKSYCKPKFWDDTLARLYLKTYFDNFKIKINWNKFKFIPLNKGFKLEDKK